MPISLAAKKKLRQDVKRNLKNLKAKKAVTDAVKKFKKNKTEKLLSEAYSAIDKARKKNIFHINKTAHMKSALSKMMGSKKSVTEKKAQKAPSKKKTSKPTKTSKKK